MSYPTIDLSSLMSAPALPMQVDDVSWTQTPITSVENGRMGTDLRAEISGFISCPDPGALASAITAIQQASYVSGSAVNILGIGGAAMVGVAPADCFDGGPHIAFTVHDEEGLGYRRITANLTAKMRRAILLTQYQLRVATAIDGLQRVDQSGSFVGTGASAAFAPLLASFKTAYPATNWLVTYEVSNPVGSQQPADGPSTSLTDATVRFRMSAQQLASTLPIGPATVVDGEMTIRSNTDEQRRITTVTEYSLHLAATYGLNYQPLVDQLRPAAGTAGQTQIIAESVRFSRVHALVLECSFTQLGSADGDGLLQYNRTIAFTTSDPTYEVYSYPGIAPIAVQKPLTFARISDSGSLVALGEFIGAPDPLGDVYGSEPSYIYTDESNAQKKTEWRYDVIDVAGTLTSEIGTLLAAISRSNVNAGNNTP